MEFMSKDLRVINEVKYLATENTARYRAIIKIFYENYKKYSYFLYKEDIHSDMKNSKNFEEYTLEMCEQDISKLMEWGNITGIQDTTKALTAEEFKSKRFIYQISEKTVIIERMVSEELEKFVTKEANLDPAILQRIKDELEKFFKGKIKADTQGLSWWNGIISDFERLNRNYSSYLSKLNSFKMEELMNTSQFIIYKDSMIDYLRNFVKGLQNHGGLIIDMLKKLEKVDIEEFFKTISYYEKKSVILGHEIEEKDIYNENINKWYSFYEWFVGNERKKGEIELLYDRTNEFIRKIVRIASQISESKRRISSRKNDYIKMAEKFIKCNTIEEAHIFSAMSFGVFNSKHIKKLANDVILNKNESIYSNQAYEIKINPKTRNYKEKIHTKAIIDKTHKKIELIKLEMKRKKEEEEDIAKLSKSNEIIFKEIGKISVNTRKTLLRWIVKGIEVPVENNEKEYESKYGINYRCFPIRKNESGLSYRVLMNNDEEVKIECEDGIFYMPDIIIELKGDL